MKILYAAGNNSNASIQLSRFLQAIEGKPYIIKVAAFKNSSPKHINIDWTLDCLLDMFRPETLSTEGENFDTFYRQIKYYNPDLIISDLEYFTSHIANILNITLWQCSSSLINFAIDFKYNAGLFTKYSYLLSKNNVLRTQRQINIIDNSNYNFVYSHLGDTSKPPSIKNKYQWIRPYHSVGKESIPCQHNVVAGLLNNNRKIFSLLQKYEDSVVFTDYPHERHKNLWLKDIENQEEYFCNLKNCNLFVCEGQTSFLADAFYNGKYCAVLINFKDTECVVNSTFSEYLKLSSNIYQPDSDLSVFLNKNIKTNYNEEIKYLHEWIEEI